MIYAVTPNGEDLLQFIIECRRLAHDETHTWEYFSFSGTPIPTGEIINCCVNISDGMRNHNSEIITLNCDYLSRILKQVPSASAKNIPSSLLKVIDYLRYFAAECLRPIELSSPFSHRSNAETNKKWWTTQSSLIAAFRNARTRFNFDFGTNHPKLNPILVWIDAIETRLKYLQAAPQTQSRMNLVFIEASAYCAAVAERNLMRAHNGQGILLLHRASDLLFIAVGAQNNAIDFSSYSGKYTPAFAPAYPTKNTITLKNSLDVLSSQLSTNASRDVDFDELNKWRNLLMQTHYMSEIDTSNAILLFNKIRLHLEALGGAPWRAAQKQYLEGIEISAIDILDSDNILTKSIEIIDY